MDGSRTKPLVFYPLWNGRSYKFFSLRWLGKGSTRSTATKYMAETWPADVSTLHSEGRKPGKWNTVDRNGGGG